MCHIGVIRLIVGIIVGICGLIGMLCLTAGYVANRNHNATQIPAECLCIDHLIVKSRCSYSCRCRTITYDCGRTNLCSRTVCDTCYKDCYYGYVNLTIVNVVYDVFKYVIRYDHEHTVINYLNEHFPIGSSTKCYYDKDKHFDISFDLKDEEGPYVAGLVFCLLAALFLVAWGIFELTILIAYCVNRCCFKHNKKSLAPLCTQCNQTRLQNIGFKMFPRYNVYRLCENCIATRNHIYDYLGNQDMHFKQSFTDTIIDMSKQ